MDATEATHQVPGLTGHKLELLPEIYIKVLAVNHTLLPHALITSTVLNINHADLPLTQPQPVLLPV